MLGVGGVFLSLFAVYVDFEVGSGTLQGSATSGVDGCGVLARSALPVTISLPLLTAMFGLSGVNRSISGAKPAIFEVCCGDRYWLDLWCGMFLTQQ